MIAKLAAQTPFEKLSHHLVQDFALLLIQSGAVPFSKNENFITKINNSLIQYAKRFVPHKEQIGKIGVKLNWFKLVVYVYTQFIFSLFMFKGSVVVLLVVSYED